MIEGGLLATVLRMVVSLAVVLGLLVLVVRFLERRGIGRGGPARDRRRVDLVVLARQQLGRSGSVQVVRAGSRILVLGVNDSGVRVLTELPDADLKREETDSAPAPTRALTLESIIRRQGSGSRAAAEAARAAGPAEAAGVTTRQEGKHRVRRSRRERR